jgi:hypothetical protein
MVETETPYRWASSVRVSSLWRMALASDFFSFDFPMTHARFLTVARQWAHYFL